MEYTIDTPDPLKGMGLTAEITKNTYHAAVVVRK